MNNIQKRKTGLTSTSVVPMKPEKLKAANLIQSKFERALSIPNTNNDRVLIEFFSFISKIQENPENEIDMSFAFIKFFKDLEEINSFKQALIIICQHDHSLFNRKNISDFIYLKKENIRLHFPLKENINYTNSILRLMDSFVHHIYVGQKTLFQSNLTKQNKNLTKNHGIILNFFQNQRIRKQNILSQTVKNTIIPISPIQELKIHMNYMKENKDKVCQFLIYMQESIDTQYCRFCVNNKTVILNEIKQDLKYQEMFQNYFGEELNHLLENIYSICLSDSSRHDCAPLLYNFEATRFSHGCTILIESFGKQYLQLESDFEEQIRDHIEDLHEELTVIQNKLFDYVKLTHDFSFAFVGSTVFLGAVSLVGHIYSNTVSSFAENLLPYSIFTTGLCSAYAGIKCVSYGNELIDQISNLFLELIDLCDADDIFAYIYKRNLSQIQPYLSAQGIDVSIHTGKTNINYFGTKILKDIANNVATWGMNSFRPTTNWWLDTTNFRRPAYPNLETETLQNYKDQMKNKIREALNHQFSFSKHRAYASYFNKKVLEPFVDPILNPVLKRRRMIKEV